MESDKTVFTRIVVTDHPCEAMLFLQNASLAVCRYPEDGSDLLSEILSNIKGGFL